MLQSRHHKKDTTHFRNISEKLGLLWLAPSRTATRQTYQFLQHYDFKIHTDYKETDKPEIVFPLVPGSDYTHDFDILPEEDEGLKIMCSVRNPYARVVALLKYHNIFREKLSPDWYKSKEEKKKNVNDDEPDSAFTSAYKSKKLVALTDEESDKLFEDKMDFDQWIERGFIKRDSHRIWLDQLHYHEYLKIHPPDYYVKMEQLAEDLMSIPEIRDNRPPNFNSIIVPLLENFTKETDEKNKKDDWRDLYTQETADIVYKNLKEQFEMFGYDRDSWKPEKPNKKQNVLPKDLIISYVDGVYIQNNSDKTYSVEIKAPKNNSYDVADLKFVHVLEPDKIASVPIKYYKEWEVNIKQGGKGVYNDTLDLRGKNVLVVLITAAIGDTIAWFPYVEEFRKKHECNVYCVTYHNHLFKEHYTDINFIEPKAGHNRLNENITARYFISMNETWESVEFPSESGIPIRQGINSPKNPRKIPLQQLSSDILGLHPMELKPKITIPNGGRPIEEKYVTISEHSNHGRAKMWNNPNGWQELVNWLKGRGYQVAAISKEPTELKGVLDWTGDKPISDRINQINHSEFFIGITSGLSWLAWATGKRVVMISGFTDIFNEFQNIRVINTDVCHGCWHRHDINFARNKECCPEHGGTEREFECTKSITSDMVIDKIKKHGLIKQIEQKERVASEKDNKYVSSRGILKSCNYHSIHPQSGIRKLINYPPLTTIKDVKTPSIYVCSSAIPDFIENVLSDINFDFVLVSGDCTEDIPYDIFKTENELNDFLNNPYLKHWLCQNWNGKNHKKVSIIPLGLDYHTMATQEMFWGKMIPPSEQEELLINIKDKSKPFWERKPICYSTFLVSMTPDRVEAYESIPEELVYYEETPVDRLTTWKNQSEYAFIISPHGIGLDCHRTWEALVLGCIPVVKKSNIDYLYDELPVLIVDEWIDITEELLNKTINDFKNKSFNYKKLTLNYWINKFKSIK